jgi:SAM-dependent methyltransferase
MANYLGGEGGKVDSQTKRVMEKYAARAKEVSSVDCPMCESGTVVSGEAQNIYNASAIEKLSVKTKLASRGCGDPVAVAGIKAGDTVVDLGSGGGIDAILASAYVGAGGRVIGIDMTPDMIELARSNAEESDCANVEFVEAEVTDIPLPDDFTDVVISNCVINLVVDKEAVFREALRILKSGGRFVFSDIVAFESIAADAREHLQNLTGCINGITHRDSYIRMLEGIGFDKVDVTCKTLYTWEVYEKRLPARGKADLLDAARGVKGIDGVCGSAIIRATKPSIVL